MINHKKRIRQAFGISETFLSPRDRAILALSGFIKLWGHKILINQKLATDPRYVPMDWFVFDTMSDYYEKL